jgi:diguanylate cyclase
MKGTGRPSSRTNGESELQQLEFYRRVQLFQLLSFVGILMLLGFAATCMMRGMLWLAVILVGVAMVGVLNMIWLYVQQNYQASAVVLSACVIFLDLLLVASGGIDNTGLFWVYPTTAIVIFINGYRVGFYLSLALLLACGYILLVPDNGILATSYADQVTIRFIATLVCLMIACVGSEYVHVHSRGRVQVLHAKVQTAAVTDALTDLPNRRFISEQCIQRGFFDRAFEGGCLVLADIDHFKRVNDEYGHDTGDQVLQAVAQYLMQSTRNVDVIVRWGGEEFLLLMPELDLNQGLHRVEDLREGLAHWPIDDLQEPLTMSFGVVEIVSAKSADALLSLADRHLYSAKAAGRNCVVC